MYEIRKVSSEKELISCSAVRKCVFGDEEKAVEALYVIDEVDRLSETKKFLLIMNGENIGTVRYIKYDAHTAKLQRMAVLKDYRRCRLASELLPVIEKDLVKEGYSRMIFDSASSAKDFYKRNGYEIISSEFYEDNRPHITIFIRAISFFMARISASVIPVSSFLV